MVTLSLLKGYRLSNGLIGQLVRTSWPLFMEFNTNTCDLIFKLDVIFLKK